MKNLFTLHLLIAAVVCSAFADQKPNIIFILSDDQGYGDLGCYGSENIKTPNIDSIREEGIKFESFYVQNRCSPTRASFMTGCHAQRIDMAKVIYHRDRSGLNANEITVAELLRDAGYATGLVGKWHLGEWPQFNPTYHGFDYFYGYIDQGGEGRVILENREKEADVDKETDRFSSKRFLPAGLEFIRKNKDQPFFLYYASNIPHTKWLPHADFAGSSEQGAYGDCVQQLDWEVGQLLKELDTLGLKENTLVIFASDNGPQLNTEGYGSAGPLRDGKWTYFEGGVRVPCVMRWPGKIPAGSTNSEITGIIDMLPTFCAMAGVDVPSDRIIDGENILPYMFVQPLGKPIHETFIFPGATIRHGDWKLFVKDQKPGGGIKKGKTDRVPAKEGSLFNLSNDLGESKDVSGAYPEKAAELNAMMETYMQAFKPTIRPRENVSTD
ncbi:sulfatase-like hydrolase/transferase [Pontiella sulfatireligans]|uniref:Arylsulfatase n=1 Tax=Pontiella sulfatireligans TaxID=2750658 RepID=A0A6C2UT70_9BACT|nr:sulfatase-like hydrolase/transferase [Pontiella sulfatireligans]SPS74576.1 sulfatase S1_14 [Kiritimatiellales bacterium]VGO23515.1 Arylsulfatase [Pontiella sulfatireligans]